jgi:hypothetical protein
MGSEKRKGERPAGASKPGEKRTDEERADAERSAMDEREEEGWSQPESSAQKGPTSEREPEE